MPGQVAPVLSALAARLPDLRLTLRTAVPRTHLLSMLPMPFELLEPPPDIGLAMRGPVAVDREASSAAYAALHRDWPAVVAREAAALARLRPDLLLSDVGYVGLAAAATEKIPGAGAVLAQLGGRDGGFLGGDARGRGADAPGLSLGPGVPPGDAAHADGVARAAAADRARSGASARATAPALLEALGLPADELLVLVSFGGIPAGRRRWRPSHTFPASPGSPTARSGPA